jgi:hypothetical protein
VGGREALAQTHRVRVSPWGQRRGCFQSYCTGRGRELRGCTIASAPHSHQRTCLMSRCSSKNCLTGTPNCASSPASQRGRPARRPRQWLVAQLPGHAVATVRPACRRDPEENRTPSARPRAGAGKRASAAAGPLRGRGAQRHGAVAAAAAPNT